MQISLIRKVQWLAGSMVTLLIILGSLGFWATSQLKTNVVQLGEDAMPGLEHIGILSAKLYRVRGDVWKHISLSDPARMQAVEQQIATLRAEVRQRMSAYESAINQPEDRQNFDRLTQTISDYWQPLEQVLTLSRATQNEQAVAAYLQSMDPVFQRILADLQSMQNWNSKYGRQAVAIARQTVNTSNTVILITLAAAILLGSVLSIYIIRTIRTTLRRAVDQLSATAEGLSAAAAQVASTSDSLAQGASDQAAGIEQVSAASEQVKSLSQQTTARTSDARHIVAEKQRQYTLAFEKIRRMASSVDEINVESEKISKIIRVIDEIAFQTNILALNAAVEAARAGQAGQGFAVVADEVRSLSQRCAQAAHDTSNLIEHSIQIAAEGKQNAGLVVQAVEELHRRAFDIEKLMSEISAASQEQTQGVGSISGSLRDLDRQTQNIAAASEEGSAAAQDLSSQAESMRISIGSLAQLAQ